MCPEKKKKRKVSKAGRETHRRVQSEIDKKLWQDPEYRAKKIAAVTAVLNSPEGNERKRIGIANHWADPKKAARARKKHSEIARKQWAARTERDKEEVGAKIAAAFEARRRKYGAAAFTRGKGTIQRDELKAEVKRLSDQIGIPTPDRYNTAMTTEELTDIRDELRQML